MDGFGSTESAVIVTRVPGTPRGSIGQGYEGVAIYDAETVTECPVAEFDENGALVNADRGDRRAGQHPGRRLLPGLLQRPVRQRRADAARHVLVRRPRLPDADGWIYLAGRTADWMRVDGENLAAAPIERILQRLPAVNRVAVYAVPDPRVGDQVMAAIVLRDEATLSPAELEQFLAEQADLSSKGWPRYVRIAADLPADRHQQGAQARADRPGSGRRRRGAVGARGARDGVRRGT